MSSYSKRGSVQRQKAIIDARNKAALRSFAGKLYSIARDSSFATMREVSQAGLKMMLEKAEFGDYTGVLANSYQAVIKEYGKDRRYDEFLNKRTGEISKFANFADYGDEGYKTNTGNANVITSLDMRGTTHISYKTYKGKGKRYELQKPRSGRHKPMIRVSKRYFRKFYQGCGRDVTSALSYNAGIRSGFSVVFNNPTPYAAHVHNRIVQGGRNRVFPYRTYGNTFLRAITEKNARKNLAYWIGQYKNGRRTT